MPMNQFYFVETIRTQKEIALERMYYIYLDGQNIIFPLTVNNVF